MEPYADSREHLRDELARLDLLLRRALLLAGDGGEAPPDEFRGLVIAESEIESLVAGGELLDQRWKRQASMRAKLEPLDARLEQFRQAIDRRRELTRRGGIELALPRLAGVFALSPAEVDLLMVALAPELEPRYETLYAYLQDDVTRKRPSVNLALELISRSQPEKLSARRLLQPQAPLLRHRLLLLGEEPQEQMPPLLRRFLKVEEAVVDFLLDLPRPEAEYGLLSEATSRVGDLELDGDVRAQVRNLATNLAGERGQGVLVQLAGRSESGLLEAARVLAGTLDRRVLLVELAQLESGAQIDALLRDALLWNAVPVVRDGEPPLPTEERRHRQAVERTLYRRLERFAGPLVLLGSPEASRRLPSGARVRRVDIAEPSFSLRCAAWETALNGRGNGIEASRLADAFRFGGGRVRQTVDLAMGLAAERDPLRSGPTIEDLFRAGRTLTTPNVGRFAVRVEPRYQWPDIVLPEGKLRQLHEIAVRLRFRQRVHRDWGFGRKLSRGKGLTVLFTGPSGTGKTMAAEILAAELSLELLQIDLSSVVSKYIGETEKNLATIFREAEDSQALLFFDEADALFGKRTEVKDAHDRYANIEVNYLLQRVEQYRGMTILATNMQRNLDEAFLRRIHEIVEFPLPDPALRSLIWQRHLPPEAPRRGDIDFEFLGRQFKLAGGDIRNIVLSAAFHAASESAPIGMSHLVLATKAEFHKQGKLCLKGDFGPFYELVHDSG